MCALTLVLRCSPQGNLVRAAAMAGDAATAQRLCELYSSPHHAVHRCLIPRHPAWRYLLTMVERH